LASTIRSGPALVEMCRSIGDATSQRRLNCQSDRSKSDVGNVDFKLAVVLRSNGFEPKGSFIAMPDVPQPDVPRWIGLGGMVLVLVLCGSALSGLLWLTVLLMIAGLALVVLENRYQRGLIGTTS
jgi:hypothetical protein